MRGTAEEELNRIADEDSDICPFYFSHGLNRGRCTEYQLRPVLCRLFGFAAVTNKHGQAEMAMCKTLKSQPQAETAFQMAGSAPKYIEYGHRLLAIDPGYGTELFPIRLAMRKAIEKALLANQYSQMGAL